MFEQLLGLDVGRATKFLNFKRKATPTVIEAMLNQAVPGLRKAPTKETQIPFRNTARLVGLAPCVSMQAQMGCTLFPMGCTLFVVAMSREVVRRWQSKYAK